MGPACKHTSLMFASSFSGSARAAVSTRAATRNTSSVSLTSTALRNDIMNVCAHDVGCVGTEKQISKHNRQKQIRKHTRTRFFRAHGCRRARSKIAITMDCAEIHSQNGHKVCYSPAEPTSYAPHALFSHFLPFSLFPKMLQSPDTPDPTPS